MLTLTPERLPSVIRMMFSSLVFIAVMFFTGSYVPAQQPGFEQGFGLVQNDYKKYEKLFMTGDEPNLSQHSTDGSPTWRKLYRDHRWKDYAEGSEHRKPMLPAQTLMGIYLTSFVDHELTYQIESIIRHKAYFSNELAEYFALGRIAAYLASSSDPGPNLGVGAGPRARGPAGPAQGGAGPDSSQRMQFYTDGELARMQRLGREIYLVARDRMVSGASISVRQRAEVRSIQNIFSRKLFIKDVEKCAAQYSSMQEKFRVMNALEQEFVYNWDPEKYSEELKKLKESDAIEMAAERAVKDQAFYDANFVSELNRIRKSKITVTVTPFDSSIESEFTSTPGSGITDPNVVRTNTAGAMPFAELQMTDEEMEEMKKIEMDRLAKETLELVKDRHKAFQYITGVYLGVLYHEETLQTIYEYYLNGADQGDPIAQIHLGLFLRYLGEFLGIDEPEAARESQEWLDKAAQSGVTKDRVEKVNKHFAQESMVTEKRKDAINDKTRIMMDIEDDKIDMVVEVLTEVAERINGVKKERERRERLLLELVRARNGIVGVPNIRGKE